MTHLLLGTYLQYYLMGIILLPGIILAIYAQAKVQSTYHKCNRIHAKSGRTGEEVARLLLDTAGLRNIKITHVAGDLSDYYDHKNKKVALSSNSKDNDTIASIGIATHEVGHALQYATNYFPIKLRTFAIACSNITSQLLWPLVILGFIFGFGSTNSNIGNYFVWAGIIFFGLAVLVNLVTLPVEFNASKRATKILKDSGILTNEETMQCKKMLNAAALTYVAALLVSMLNFLRFLLVFTGRDRD